MKYILEPGVTGEKWLLFIQDSSRSDGGGLTGLSNSTAGLICYYIRDNANAPVAVSLVPMTLGTYTSGGFVVVDDTHLAGWYEFCPPDAAFVAGAKKVGFSLSGAANMAQVPVEVQLGVGIDIANDVWATSLPGAYALPQAGARMLQAYDALEVDAHAEPVNVPPANATLQQKIDWLFMLARNKLTQTAATQNVYNDAGGSIIASASVSDDGTLFQRSEYA